MANVVSTIAALQLLALSRGPHRGPVSDASKLHLLDDVATAPVGTVATATDSIRFGRIPAGAKIIPFLSRLSSDHSALQAGKLQLVPIDGVGTVQEIASVTVAITAVTVSFLENAAALTVAKDSWIQFVPAADLVIASTAKPFRARIVYAELT